MDKLRRRFAARNRKKIGIIGLLISIVTIASGLVDYLVAPLIGSPQLVSPIARDGIIVGQTPPGDKVYFHADSEDLSDFHVTPNYTMFVTEKSTYKNPLIPLWDSSYDLPSEAVNIEIAASEGLEVKVTDIDQSIEQMSMEEKYDKLYDQYVLTDAIALAFIKEMGLTEKFMDHQMKVYKKSIPSMMGPVFKLIKMLAPGRTFKMLVKENSKELQVLEPQSSIELVSLSDREAVIKQKNSVLVKKYRDMIKESGLNLDIEEMHETTNESFKEMLESFGFECDEQIEGDTITTTVELLK